MLARTILIALLIVDMLAFSACETTRKFKVDPTTGDQSGGIIGSGNDAPVSHDLKADSASEARPDQLANSDLDTSTTTVDSSDAASDSALPFDVDDVVSAADTLIAPDTTADSSADAATTDASVPPGPLGSVCDQSKQCKDGLTCVIRKEVKGRDRGMCTRGCLDAKSCGDGFDCRRLPEASIEPLPESTPDKFCARLCENDGGCAEGLNCAARIGKDLAVKNVCWHWFACDPFSGNGCKLRDDGGGEQCSYSDGLTSCTITFSSTIGGKCPALCSAGQTCGTKIKTCTYLCTTHDDCEKTPKKFNICVKDIGSSVYGWCRYAVN